MKKFLIIIIVALLPCWVGAKMANIFYGGGIITNYTADANCQGAWYMNGGLSANGDDETDRSGNSITLTETSGDIPNSATVPSGYSGNSRDFEEDESEYLLVAEASAGGLDVNGENASISILAWVNMEAGSIENTEVMGIVTKWDWGSSNKQYDFALYGTGSDTFKVRMRMSSDGSSNDVTLYSTTTNYAAGTWYHIAVVSNDTDVRIYVNGSLDCTPDSYVGGLYDGNGDVVVGASDEGSGSEIDGLLDEVAVFDRELTAAEVKDIYNNGLDGTKGGND